MQSSDVYLFAGRNLLEESLKSGHLKSVYFSSSFKNLLPARLAKIVHLLEKKHISISFEDKRFFDSFEKKYNTTTEGVIFKTSVPRISLDEVMSSEDNSDSLICFVDDLTFSANMGSILRSASAFGVKALVISSSSKLTLNQEVARYSMGGIFYVPVIHESTYAFLDKAKRNGYNIIGFDINQTLLYNTDSYTSKDVLFFGGESKGISPNVRNKMNRVLAIPMSNTVQSLNVSVTVGIILSYRYSINV